MLVYVIYAWVWYDVLYDIYVLCKHHTLSLRLVVILSYHYYFILKDIMTSIPARNTQFGRSNVIDGSTTRSNNACTEISCQIPMYSQIVKGDYDEEFALQFLQEMYPETYEEYQNIKNGTSTNNPVNTSKLNTRRVFGKQLRPQSATSSAPEIQAQEFLNRVLPQALWCNITQEFTIPSQQDGQLNTFEWPVFKYNTKDSEELFKTGNLVDSDYSDNGVACIPLQMTLLPILSQLQQYLSTAQYFKIVDNDVKLEFGGIQDDFNATGLVTIVYVSPGTNKVCNFDTLASNTNGTFKLEFGVAEKQTVFHVLINNKIGNNGEFECIPNGWGSNLLGNIINSAGNIFLLDTKRTQDHQNPCLANCPGWKISSYEDFKLIKPDGYVNVSFTLELKGQNSNAEIFPILARLGELVVQGKQPWAEPGP